jgi:spore maturation protein SpmA/spore maturation protein SpmB
MLNYIWLALIAFAVLIGGLTGRIDAVGAAAIDRANAAVIAIMTLWLGLMRLAEKAGLVHRLGLALRPVMTWLFPEVPADHPAMGAIILNMAANILGLNNAATPLGLRAMSELDKLNRRPGVATNAMCMLLAINTSSITLIPVTVIGVLSLAHAKNPTAIIGPAIAASLVAHIAAIGACKLLERTRFYRLPAPDLQTLPPTPLEETDLKSPRFAEGKKVQEQAVRTDAELPWVPNAGYILAAAGGLFLAMLVITAFPEVIGPIPPDGHPFQLFAIRMSGAWSFFTSHPGAGSGLFFRRLLDAVSVMAIPLLILFFPLYATLRRIPVYEEFVEGGKEGFQVIIRILPYIVGMLVATGMFTAAGGMELIKYLIGPVTSFFGFPADLVPLAFIRPFSGTASLPLLKDIVDRFGPDSFLAHAAGTMYGCSETTFYVIAVYFGSVGIRKTRHAIPAGIVADIVGPIASVLICRAVFG